MLLGHLNMVCSVLFWCEISKIIQCEIIQVMYVIRKGDFSPLVWGVSLHKSNQPSKISQCLHECIVCSPCYLFPHTFDLLHMGHEHSYFYLHFKMSKSKQLGVRNCSAPVILSMERKSVLEHWETCWRETEQASMCRAKEWQRMIEDGVRGLAKQPWCNLSSCSQLLATSCSLMLFSLTSTLPLVR